MRCFAYQWVTLGFVSISENWVKSIFCLTEIFERHKCSETNSFLLYQRKCKKKKTKLTLNELTLDLVWCIWKYRLTLTVNTSFISVSPPSDSEDKLLAGVSQQSFMSSQQSMSVHTSWYGPVAAQVEAENRFYAEQIILEMSPHSLPASAISKSSRYNCCTINTQG